MHLRIQKYSLYLYIVLLHFIQFNTYAQENITIGTKHSLYSETLKENRPYWIYLPKGYNDTIYAPAKYPVVYLLDGDRHHHSFAGIQEFFSHGPYASLPEFIVVSILNTDRDLTPTHA
jgi:predicted alpha/beta superfamily hydrolase